MQNDLIAVELQNRHNLVQIDNPVKSLKAYATSIFFVENTGIFCLIYLTK